MKCKPMAASYSPYGSPVVLVRKKSGKIRMCVDYHTLNRCTKRDQYAMPRVQDVLNCLVGSQWFPILDLQNGYHIPLAPEDKDSFHMPIGVLLV